MRIKVLFPAITIAVCSLLFACKNADTDNSSDFKYNITMTELSQDVSWYDLVDSVSYIVLKSPDNSVMGHIYQLIMTDDRIYVRADGFYCFDMEGNCLFKQTTAGRARNEFIKASSMSVSDGKLFIYDRQQHKGLFYDALTGKYISSVSIGPNDRSGYFFNGHIICRAMQLNETEDPGFNVFSGKEPYDQVKELFHGKEFTMAIDGTENWSNDNGLIFTSYRRNLAWKITGSDFIPYIRLTVPDENTVPEEAIEQMIENNALRPDAADHGYIYGLSHIAESDSHIFGRVSDNSNFIFFIYDKKTGNSRFFNFPAIEYWQISPFIFVSEEKPLTAHRDYICTALLPDVIMTLKKYSKEIQEPANENFRKAYDICNSLTGNEYAVVAKIWFK